MLHLMQGKMWVLAALTNTVLSLLLSPPATLASGTAPCPSYGDVQNQLGKRLSPGTYISTNNSDAPRWSLYGAPTPAFIVNVASESDIATIVSKN